MSKLVQEKCSKGPIEMEVYSISSPKSPTLILRSFSTANPYENYNPELPNDDTKIRTQSTSFNKFEEPANTQPNQLKKYPNKHSNTILTSKDDVYQYLNTRSTRKFKRFGDMNNIPCQHCLLQ